MKEINIELKQNYVIFFCKIMSIVMEIVMRNKKRIEMQNVGYFVSERMTWFKRDVHDNR